MNPGTFLLAEISQNIKDLQLQLDYEKSRLTSALGGDPVLYDVAGTGAIIGGTGKIGNGSAIAGAMLQVDGDLVVGDGAGAAGAKITSLGKVHCRGIAPMAQISLANNAAREIIPTSDRGIVLTWSHSAHTASREQISGVFGYDITTPAIARLAGYPDVLTVALTGSTGTDGKFSVSAYNGKIYVENRLGILAFIGIIFIA